MAKKIEDMTPEEAERQRERARERARRWRKGLKQSGIRYQAVRLDLNDQQLAAIDAARGDETRDEFCRRIVLENVTTSIPGVTKRKGR